MKIAAVIFDIDGTIADCSHRRHFVESKPKNWDAFYSGVKDDKPKENAAQVFYMYRTLGYKIIFVTGRPERIREETSDWLDLHLNISSHGDYKLYMRPNNDFTPDHEMKKEIYLRDIEPYYDVKLVLDDRSSVVKMWRSLGLECWQVDEGEF